MTEQDFINRLKVSNLKLFADPNIRLSITPKSLEKLIKQSFQAGVQSEREKKSLFEQVFGMFHI